MRTRTLKAFVFSLSLIGALAGATLEAPMAMAGDPSTDAATKFLDDAQKRLDAMAPGDRTGAAEIVKLTNQAISRLNGSSKKGTPEWNDAAKRAKEIDAAARAKSAQAPAPPPTPAPTGGTPAPTGGGTPAPTGGSVTPPAAPASEPDEPLLDAKAKVEELEKAVTAMALNDKAEFKSISDTVATVVVPLLTQSKARSHPLWAEVKKRAEKVVDNAQAKSKGKDPSATPAGPAVDWTGEPDLSKVSAGDKQKFDAWKADYEAYWRQLYELEPAKLAANPEGEKRSFDSAFKKSRDALRRMIKSSLVTDFVTKKEQDFSLALDARVAAGKQAQAEAEAKTDDALNKAAADAQALEGESKALKMGDAAAADALLARQKAALALLETTTAKSNPSYAKTKALLATVAERIDLRKSGKADDPTLGIDLSDAPLDALDKGDVSRFNEWKDKFSTALKAMQAWSDVDFCSQRRNIQAEGDMNRAREATINRMRNNAGLLPWIDRKEGEYKALLQKKLAAGQKVIDDQAASVAARHDEGKKIAAEIQAAKELTTLEKVDLDINMKYEDADQPKVEAFVQNAIARREMQKKWAEKATKMRELLSDSREPTKVQFTGSAFPYKEGDPGYVAGWILSLEKGADESVTQVLKWFEERLASTESNCRPLAKFVESEKDQLAWPTDEGGQAAYAQRTSEGMHAGKFAQLVEVGYKGAAAPTWQKRVDALNANLAEVQAAQKAAVAAVRFPADKEKADSRLSSAAEAAFKHSGYEGKIKRFIVSTKAQTHREATLDGNSAYIQRWEEFDGWAVWEDSSKRLRIVSFTAKYNFEGRGDLEEWFISNLNAWDIILPENVSK